MKPEDVPDELIDLFREAETRALGEDVDADYSVIFRAALAAVLSEHENPLRAERDALKAELAEARAAMQHLAAEAHRRKWAHEHASPAAFDVLHRIGNELKAALSSRPDDPEEIRRLAQATESGEENADD